MHKCGTHSPPDEWCYPPDLDVHPFTIRPLVILMSGRGTTVDAMLESGFPKFGTINNDLKAIVFGIEGDTSTFGANSWNASAECCWPPGDPAPGDDDAYIDSKIDELIAAGWPVDPKQIYIIGHSAGSAMAFRYACNHPSRVAAILQMSAFGLRTDTDAACAAGHFSAVHFHGTGVGEGVLYDNTTNNAVAPNTVEYVSVEVDRAAPTRTSTAAQLKAQNGCTGTLDLFGTLDFDADVGGNETDLKHWTTCPADGAVEIWKGNGSAHSPNVTAAGVAAVVSFFRSHPKP